MRLDWNHNNHYHSLLLRQVPPGCRRALDVGCGDGDFARQLATRVPSVDAVDRSPEMIALAHSRSRHASRVEFVTGDILDLDLDKGYGFISCIASLHHMPFDRAAPVLRDALEPGGVLAVVGLYRAKRLSDYLISSAAFAAHWAIRLPLSSLQLAMRRSSRRELDAMPLRDPDMTLDDIVEAAAVHLPGARIRRLLFFRYLLLYRHPVG